jgi:hypothetical protein
LAGKKELVVGDYVECQVHVGGPQYEWCKGRVAGVRDTNFDVEFNPPAGPMKVGMGLFHKDHYGKNWRFDPNPPSPVAPETETETPEGSSDASS